MVYCRDLTEICDYLAHKKFENFGVLFHNVEHVELNS
jgi:hypothetical protein